MTQHTEQQSSPYSAKQIFELVADVELYPEFLPWCRAARILEKGEGEMLAELLIRFGHMSESYTSRVTLTPYERIEVVMVKGPFEYLTNHWHLTEKAEGGTTIDFALDFKFRSKILEKLIGGVFTKATSHMIEAFSKRADALYAGKTTE